jgi:arylsulfatase A-like enzyme
MDPHDPYFRHPLDGHGISHRRTPNPDPSLIPEMKELYAGEVRFWDQAFGEFVKGLEQRGLMEDTLLVVVSDHGEEFGEHGGFWHGTTLYDEQLRILFVAKFPSSAGVAGAVVPDWVKLADVAPFILDAAGLPIPQEMQGSPRPTSAASPVFAEGDHQGNVLKSVRMLKEGAEVKLIQANPGNPRGLADLELYRVDEDPMELKNLSDQQAELLAETQAELQKQAEAVKQGAAQAVHGDLSGEAKKILGNLGYMNDEEH